MEGHAVDSGVQETKRRLKRAGFKGDDLEAMTEVIAGMEERLATKEALAGTERVLKEDLARTERVLKQDIAGVRTELREDLRERFDGFRQETGGNMDGLRAR